MKDKHSEKVTVICEICGKVLSSRSLRTHMASHLPPRHACVTCDYRTWHKRDLAKHQMIHTGIKMYLCEFCSASFHTSSNLRAHIIHIHHEGAAKRFSCKQCERTFHSWSKLSMHQDTHNDIKRYACEVCHSCFTRRCYWKKHMDRQHGISVPPKRRGRHKTNIIVG